METDLPISKEMTCCKYNMLYSSKAESLEHKCSTTVHACRTQQVRYLQDMTVTGWQHYKQEFVWLA